MTILAVYREPFGITPHVRYLPEGETLAGMRQHMRGLPADFDARGVICINGHPCTKGALGRDPAQTRCCDRGDVSCAADGRRRRWRQEHPRAGGVHRDHAGDRIHCRRRAGDEIRAVDVCQRLGSGDGVGGRCQSWRVHCCFPP